jgi:hypothetical protein
VNEVQSQGLALPTANRPKDTIQIEAPTLASDIHRKYRKLKVAALPIFNIHKIL